MKPCNDYQFVSSLVDGIIEIIFTGEVTSFTLNQLHTDVVKTIREKGPEAVLCDVRALKGPNDIAAAYFRTRNTPTDVKVLPCAIISETSPPDFTSFYETTAANAGQSLKYFRDTGTARAWLKQRLGGNTPKDS